MNTDYLVTVKTSDKPGAGTDANVFVRLLGDNGDLELQLKTSQKFNKFERNSVDYFTFHDEKSCGPLKSIRVWHDDSGNSTLIVHSHRLSHSIEIHFFLGFGASWHLEYVEISDVNGQKKYRFPCHRWFSKTEEDKQISRELKCTEIATGPSKGFSSFSPQKYSKKDFAQNFPYKWQPVLKKR